MWWCVIERLAFKWWWPVVAEQEDEESREKEEYYNRADEVDCSLGTVTLEFFRCFFEECVESSYRIFLSLLGQGQLLLRLNRILGYRFSSPLVYKAAHRIEGSVSLSLRYTSFPAVAKRTSSSPSTKPLFFKYSRYFWKSSYESCVARRHNEVLECVPAL